MDSYTAVCMAPLMPEHRSMPTIGSAAANCTPAADARREEEAHTAAVSESIRALLATHSPELVANYLANAHATHEVDVLLDAVFARKRAMRKQKLLAYVDRLKGVAKKMGSGAGKVARKVEEIGKGKGKERIVAAAPLGQGGFEPRTGLSTRTGPSGSTLVVDWRVSGPSMATTLAPRGESAGEDLGEDLPKDGPPGESSLGGNTTKGCPSRAAGRDGRYVTMEERIREFRTTDRKLTVGCLGKYVPNERGSRFTERAEDL